MPMHNCRCNYVDRSKRSWGIRFEDSKELHNDQGGTLSDLATIDPVMSSMRQRVDGIRNRSVPPLHCRSLSPSLSSSLKLRFSK